MLIPRVTPGTYMDFVCFIQSAVPPVDLFDDKNYLGPLLKGVCTWLFHNKKTIGHNDFKAEWNGTFSLWKTGGVCLFDVKYLYEIMCRTLRIFLYKGHVTFHIKWKVITLSIKCMISFKNKWTPYDQISCKFYFDWPSYGKITEVLALRN